MSAHMAHVCADEGLDIRSWSFGGRKEGDLSFQRRKQMCLLVRECERGKGKDIGGMVGRGGTQGYKRGSGTNK